MTRIILRALSSPVLVLLAMIAIALQTSLFIAWPLNFFQPDIILILVVWIAMKRPFIEGGVLTLIFAEIAELHSAVPQGIFLINYMAVYLWVRLADKVLVIPNMTYYSILTGAASILWRLVGLGVLNLLGASQNQWRHTLTMLFPGATIEALLSIWVFKAMERYDWVTHRSVRTERALGDEVYWEAEGF